MTEENSVWEPKAEGKAEVGVCLCCGQRLPVIMVYKRPTVKIVRYDMDLVEEKLESEEEG